MRNHLVRLMVARKQGAHGKTKKAMRRNVKMQIQRECSETVITADF